MGTIEQKIAHAFWESDNSGIIILSQAWDSLKKPQIEFKPVVSASAEVRQLTPPEVGRYYRYYRLRNHWVFAIRTELYPQLLDLKTKVYLAGEFNGWGDALGDSKWQLKPVKRQGETTYELAVPLKSLPREGRVAFKFVTEAGDWLNVPESAPNKVAGMGGMANFEFDAALAGKQVLRFFLGADYKPSGNERIVLRDASGVETYELPNTQYLTQAKTPLKLGAFVESGRTVFRLFAPRATHVKLAYGQQADASDAKLLSMKCVDGVTWEARIAQDLDGWFYTYRIDGKSADGTTYFDKSFAVLDPYAKACVSHRGPGIVVASERMPKVATPFVPPAWHDLVILEAHIRDLVCHAPIKLTAKERNGYAGVRKWLKAEGSYLTELGVNAVELQPIQEFDNHKTEDYHWGYMTVNFFSPESSYAKCPEKASQVEEFRGMVQDFHDAGMAVILDVVYNHVGEPNHLLFVDKFYYFNLDDTNDLVNWSGCGNDLRCETPMGRRLIIESLTHLVETYDVDGFRFDLAELIGIDVLREIETELKKVKPSLILIAEPWSFRGHIQDELKETGFASWNDGFRESISKYVCGDGNQDMIRHFLSGSPDITRFAAQTINYTESHDDYCWLDRITERDEHDGSDPTMLDRRRTHLMAAVLFGALGVPMLAQGQDFLRSKRGISNTYQRGDVNALDYNRRYVYSGTHGYFRDWIKFRLSEQGRVLRLSGGFKSGYIEFHHTEGSSAVLALFNADRSQPGQPLLFGINPHFDYADIKCERLQQMDLRQIADQERFNVSGLESALIPIREAYIHMPPLSCGVWLVEV
ncbi:MAG: pullulanase [Lentimonas sp.]|jgi:pullulanase